MAGAGSAGASVVSVASVSVGQGGPAPDQAEQPGGALVEERPRPAVERDGVLGGAEHGRAGGRGQAEEVGQGEGERVCRRQIEVGQADRGARVARPVPIFAERRHDERPRRRRAELGFDQGRCRGVGERGRADERGAGVVGRQRRLGHRREGQHRARGHGAAVAGGPEQGQLRRSPQAGGRIHHGAGHVGPTFGDVVDGLGHQEVAVGVEGAAEAIQPGQVVGGEPERVRVGRQHRETVADPPPLVLGAEREPHAEPGDVGQPAHHTLDLATDDLAQVRAHPHLLGQPVGVTHRSGGEVQLPARRRRVVHCPVP